MEDFTDESIHDPQVNSLAARMRVEGLPEGSVGPVDLTIRLKDGKEYTESPIDAKGYILGKPMSRDEIIAKFMDQVEFSKMVSLKNAQKLVGLIEKLEEADNLNEILTSAVKRS